MQPHLLMSPRLAQPFGRVAPGIICCENDETGEKYYTGVSFKEGWKCPEGWHRSDGCTEFPPPPEQRVRGPQVPPLLPSASPIPTGRRPTPRPAVPTPPTAVPHVPRPAMPFLPPIILHEDVQEVELEVTPPEKTFKELIEDFPIHIDERYPGPAVPTPPLDPIGFRGGRTPLGPSVLRGLRRAE